MFRRHCANVFYLNKYPEIDYILFLDGDMGVINPKHYIEEYINSKFDLVFYNRYYDYEVASGSYIAKNSDYAKNFLTYWADYNFHVPNSFHGTDNGALHQVFMDKFLEYDVCRQIWNASKNWDDLFIWEACVRHELGGWKKSVFDDRIKVIKKNENHWVRDGWLTETRWSDEEFMFHSWKESKKGHSIKLFNSWIHPFCNYEFDMGLCLTNDVMENWKYKAYLKLSNEEIRSKLDKISSDVRKDYSKALTKAFARLKL